MTSPDVSWEKLLGHIVNGPAYEPPITGRIHSTEGYEQPMPKTPYFNIPSSTHGQWRVLRDGVRMRIENDDGTPMLITDGITVWRLMRRGQPPLKTGMASLPLLGNGLNLLTRPPAKYLNGSKSYTGIIGEIGDSSYLGRPVWTITLAPAPRKECSLHLSVDIETGIILHWRTDNNLEIYKWTEFSTSDAIPDELFRWPT